MRIEFKGYLIIKLSDGRIHAKNVTVNHEFIVDEIEEAIFVIQTETN